MQLQTEIFGDVVVVHTPEELSHDQAESLERFLPTLQQQQVVLDLDNTESLDSRGLTALLDGQELMRELGGNLKVATTNHVNRKILEVTRLDEHLEVFQSIVDAVKSYC